MPLVDLTDVAALVELLNALGAYWPRTQALVGASLPFGSKVRPVPLTANYYTALSDVFLPPNVQLVAGLVRGDVPPDSPGWSDWVGQHQRALNRIERIADRGPWKISTPCGWSRAPENVKATVRLLLALSDEARD
jgi:hypothetical protein